VLANISHAVEAEERAGRPRRGLGTASSARQRLGAIVEVTAARVRPADSEELRLVRAAHVLRERAAVGEHAPRGVGPEIGQEARDRVEPGDVLAQAATRDAAEEADRVRVPWVTQNALRLSLLDDPTGVQDADAVAHASDQREVVRDEEHGGLNLVAEPGDQVGTCLHGHVEATGLPRRGAPALRKRHGNDDALLHAAGELVRVALEDEAGSAICTRASASRSAPGPAARRAAHLEDLGDLPADPERQPSAEPGFW
jgi:hypothetical protein